MRRTGSLDRLGLPLAVWAAETDRQQQPLLNPARLAPAEYRLTGVVADRTAGGGRLADTVRSFAAAAGDFCGSPALPWWRVSRGQLGRPGNDARISAHAGRLQGESRGSQE